MKGRDEIKELFSEKLGNYEAKVNPELWTNIASQIGAATVTTAASTGISLLTKWIIGVSIASAVAVTAIFVVNNADEAVAKEIPKTEKIAETNPSSDENSQVSIEMDGEKIAVVEQNSAPQEEREIKRQNWDDIPMDIIPREIKTVNEQTETLIDIKNPLIETEGIKKKEQNVPPVTKEPKPNVADVIIENQTPEEAELSYKIGELRNVFTPNGDGVNDIFFIESEGLSDFNVVVMDAKSKVVFQSNNPDFNWDGNDISGNPLPADRYVYFITAKDKDGAFIKKGNGLTIKR